MSLLPPVGWADVATKTDLRGIQTDLRGIQTDLRAVETRLDSRIDRLESRIDVLRSDLLSEMHQSIRNQTWALVAWTTALAGLIVALTR